MIRTLIVEDFPIIREAIARAVSLDPRVHLLGAHGTGRDLLDAMVVTSVDAVLVDLHLPDIGGSELIRRVRQVSPRTRILVFTASEQPGQVKAALTAGAHGYVVKRQDAPQVIEALVAVCAGGTVLSPQITGSMLAGHVGGGIGGPGEALRDGDLEIVERVIQGQTDSEIARAIFVSTRTVQNHLARIRRVAGVARRPELARWALDNNLV